MGALNNLEKLKFDTVPFVSWHHVTSPLSFVAGLWF